ncbi:hypothetical protein PG993_014153 [Apiospora rasikravindrae]|uniref:Zn(2)-C6 fungal-type domain-containing protein n=1 Tax=Apiospora rasikravindrae TaxID=990691 RepID=A0ABR1RSN2_9PEZI
MPRPMLNCITCRRRKVRCGREQPACTNCLRLNEHCGYEPSPRVQTSRHEPSPPTETSAPQRFETSTEEGGIQDTMLSLFSEGWTEWAPAGGDPLGFDHTTDTRPESWGGVPASTVSKPMTDLPTPTAAPAPWHDTDMQLVPAIPQFGGVWESTLTSSFEDITKSPTQRPTGYLSIGNQGRQKYIGNAFWALIGGHASSLKVWDW